MAGPYAISSAWRNVGSRGGLLKTSDTAPSGGKVYVFHNTILQSVGQGLQYPMGAKGLGHGGPMHNVTTRNNILHVYKSSADSINDRTSDPLGDYDYDPYNGDRVAAGTPELHGIEDTPTYQAPSTFGDFTLAPSSAGYDQGVLLLNFSDGFTGSPPDRRFRGRGEGALPRSDLPAGARLLRDGLVC